MRNKNYFLTNKVELDGGDSNTYGLVLGIEDPKVVAEKEYARTPTWGKLLSDLVDFCLEEKICLNYLHEQGSVQNGGSRCMISAMPQAGKYIMGRMGIAKMPVQ
jgi:hypothetical protein